MSSTSYPYRISALVFALLTAAVGCREAREAERAQVGMAEQAEQAIESPPDTSGAALFAHLGEVEYRENWETWPGKGELYTGREPHGMLLTTYLNPVAHDALMNKAGEFADGSVIVKENYAPDSSFAAITVMYKVSGYNPEAADWFWVKLDPQGEVAMEGKAEGRVESCIACHRAQADNDYIFTGSLQ